MTAPDIPSSRLSRAMASVLLARFRAGFTAGKLADDNLNLV